MKEFSVRVYEDHYLVTGTSVGVGTFPVDMGALEEALTAEPTTKKPAAAKKPRKRRTKAEIEAAKAEKAGAAA